MSSRINFSSGGPFEAIVGYSRAVRVGSQVFVSGSTCVNSSGEYVGVGDPYAQSIQAIRNIEAGLNGVGASLDDVVRTRIYVVDIEVWPEIARAHAEVFGAIRPAATMVEVKALIDPRMLVEIEADAVVSGS